MTKPNNNSKWYSVPANKKAWLYKTGASILALGFMYRGIYDSLLSVVNQDVSLGVLQIVAAIVVLATVGIVANCDNK